METIGARLKKIRLEKGLSLEEVHRKTKIHLNVLKAIEEDSLVNFSPIYIKGFLKIYCNFLGVDIGTVVSDLKENKTQAVKPVHEKEIKAVPPSVKASSIKIDVLKEIRSKIKIVMPVILIIVSIVILVRVGKFVISKIKLLPKRTKVASVKVAPVKKEKQGAKVEAVKPQKVQAPVEAVEPRHTTAALSGIRLNIRAKEDCWMQVKIDGKVIFQNILKKGRSENWKAKEKIELSLGNAGVVELEVNDKWIQSLGRRGQAVKNILITKDGLTTSR
jgi:cytoskeletal protein RodZ